MSTRNDLVVEHVTNVSAAYRSLQGALADLLVVDPFTHKPQSETWERVGLINDYSGRTVVYSESPTDLLRPWGLELRKNMTVLVNTEDGALRRYLEKF